jgi:hypothetical protein
MLLLPGDPGFLEILYGQLPPVQSAVYVVREGTGLLEPATEEDLSEYLEGGEYDEVTHGELDDGEIEIDPEDQ